jgi:glycosyltransferase involved in cell wall biosynthesis
MKIIELAPNVHPINSIANNAIYSHTASLSDGLADKGHNVHVFCSEESVSRAHMHISTIPLSKMEDTEKVKKYHTFKHIAKAFEFAKKESVDIIHSHFTMLSSFFYRLVDIPTLISVHSPITEDIKQFLDVYKDCKFVSFSLAQRKQMPELNWYANIYHGVDTAIFSYEAEPEDYMLYLGRVTEEKGVHFAIETAKATGIPLKIAGPSYPTEGYWHKKIEPFIDGKLIQYVGRVNFFEKIKLLQKAKVVLFPTKYHEAFGYVLIEAMSCGTPVVGFGNGSVPEIIKHGKTGYVVNNVEEMIKAVGKIDKIDRKVVRKRAEDFFSLKKMISGYEKVFKRIVEERNFTKENGKNKTI